LHNFTRGMVKYLDQGLFQAENKYNGLLPVKSSAIRSLSWLCRYV